jgi:octaprenyl-diphosphate synthase
MSLKDISRPVKADLDKFNSFLKGSMKSDVALLNLVISYMTKKKGKQVRPMLVFLSAQLCGEISERTYIGASMVELLHNATLIHDDVVDEASVRRGMASINSSWNNKIAVLIGDYLLAKGLLNAIDGDEFDFLKATSKSVKRMSEGELLQIQKSKDFDTDEETYFKIISNKTASLMSNCCEIGAISASSDKKSIELLGEYGDNVGLAFQIRDDIFDFKSNGSIIGKPVGNDLKEKKLTLPLIYSLSRSSKSECKEIIKMIKKGNLKSKDIAKIADYVTEKGGIAYSEKKAREFIAIAIEKLSSFEDVPAKSSLIEFANFVIERKK